MGCGELSRECGHVLAAGWLLQSVRQANVKRSLMNQVEPSALETHLLKMLREEEAKDYLANSTRTLVSAMGHEGSAGLRNAFRSERRCVESGTTPDWLAGLVLWVPVCVACSRRRT